MNTTVFRDKDAGRMERSMRAVTKQEVWSTVKEIAKEYGFAINEHYGVDDLGPDVRITIEKNISFVVNVTIYFRNRWDWSKQFESKEGIKAIEFNYDAEINWAGTSRDMVSAQASVNLYQKALDFSNHLLAVTREVDVLIKE
jgi:hypothetical protein